jgi:hypothetical protein
MAGRGYELIQLVFFKKGYFDRPANLKLVALDMFLRWQTKKPYYFTAINLLK